MEEEWRVISRDDRYEVSSLGHVRHRRLNRVIKSFRTGIRLGGVGGEYRTYSLAKLVCEAFHGPSPEGQVLRRRDDDTANVSAANLYWGSPKGAARAVTTHPVRVDPPEEWRAVHDHPEYEVSSLGRVRETTTGVVVSGSRRAGGALPRMDFPSGGSRLLRVLVCEAFHGPRPGSRWSAAPLNNDPADVRAANLFWKEPDAGCGRRPEQPTRPEKAKRPRKRAYRRWQEGAAFGGDSHFSVEGCNN